MKASNFIRFLLAASSIIAKALGGDASDHQSTTTTTTPEAVFRQALLEYRSVSPVRNSVERWTMWVELATILIEQAQDFEPMEIIQALEASILVIERAVFRAGEADDLPRDKALAHLYFAYGNMLQSLSAQDCTRLALDEQTLLIGAETADATKPSQHLCRENAENALRNAATLDATHEEAARLLDDLLQQESIDGVHKRKPKEFVAELFDSFADTFDSTLGALGYRVPRLVGEAAAGQRPSGYLSALDAGCGTGLAGRFLRPLVRGPLIGVDASQKMVDIANKCTMTSGCGIEENGTTSEPSEPLYDGLFVMDLEDMSVSNTLQASGVTRLNVSKENVSGFDLVVAADVLVYFGRLDTILQTFASVSLPGAVLLFSCERASEEDAPLGFRLLSSGRFAHTKAHVEVSALTAGYELVTVQDIVPRMEKGEEVQGYLFTFILRDEDRDEL